MPSRIAKFQKLLSKMEVDGLLVSNPVNRNYLSRFSGSAGYLILTPSKAWFLTDSRYTTQAKKEVEGASIVLQSGPPLAHVATLVRDARIRNLGFEQDHVTVSMHASLVKALPQVKLAPAGGTIEAMRAVKDRDEMEAMRQAASIADRSLAHVLGTIKPGVRESDVATEMEHHMRQLGASGPSFETIVASGWRAALPHGIASDKKIAKGDLVVIDFGCIYKHYCSDMTRTVAVGQPKSDQRKIYRIVQQAQARSLASVRQGTTCAQVDLKARGFIKSAGFSGYFGHGTGHGVGMEVHEEPRVGPKSPTVLKAGMAVTVEPGIYLPNRFGVRIEDTVFVTAKGSENLYKTTHDLIVV
jgi:Xaa-Pro aminopeptidase